MDNTVGMTREQRLFEASTRSYLTHCHRSGIKGSTPSEIHSHLDSRRSPELFVLKDVQRATLARFYVLQVKPV